MARSFYFNDQTPSVPGLPEIANSEDVLQKPTPITKSYESLKPQSPIVVNQFGSQIATSPALESIAAEIRQKFSENYELVSEKVDYYSSIAVSHWGMTVDRTKSFISEEDVLLPNTLYVLSATLLGSIVSRNRLFPIRFCAPWLFAGLSMKFVLPGTYNNIMSSLSNKYLQLEQSKMPELKQSREESLKGLQEFQKAVETSKESAWVQLVGAVHDTRKSISNIFASKKD